MTILTNQSLTSDTRGYLSGYTTPTETCGEESKIPKMSNVSANLYSNIRQCIPNTNETFLSIKRPDISATEITTSNAKIAELKKNEILHKVGSVIVIALLVTLIAAVILTAIFVPIVAPGLFMGGVLSTGTCAIFFSVNLGVLGPVLPLYGIVLSGFWADYAFKCVPNAQKELSAKVEEEKGNHEKFKTYFSYNYETLKKEIETSIDATNEFLKVMTGKKGASMEKLERQYTLDLLDFQEASNQLETLHNFYTQADSTK